MGVFFLDVQIYNLHLILNKSYNIAYCDILLGVSFHKSLYFCILQFPLYSYTYFYDPVYIFLRIYIYLYFPNMCNFLFSLLMGFLGLPSFGLCLLFVLVFHQVYQYLLAMFFRILLFFYLLFLRYLLFLFFFVLLCSTFFFCVL